MFCSKCGAENRDGSKFCSVCGMPFSEPAAQPAVQYAPSASMPENQYNVRYGNQGMPVPPKKKRKGLIIGLIAGILVLLGGAAALYFFVFAGTAVNGYWYNDETSMAFEFKDNGKAVQYSLMGKEEAGCDYNRQAGEGTLDLGGAKYDFTVDKDTLTFSEKGVRSKFKRADKDFDAADFLSGRLKGLYTNKPNAEVLELDGKTVISHSFTGDVKGTYVYDFDKGKGTLTFNGTDIKFSATSTDISLDTYGMYTKEAKSLDTNSFLYECLNGIYLNKDIPEVLEFKAGKVVVTHDTGGDSTGTFDYDFSKGAGTIKMGGKNFTFTVSSGTMKVSGVGDYPKQADGFNYAAYLKQVSNPLVGDWYDTKGMYGTLSFSSGGDATLSSPDGTSTTGKYTFDSKTGKGVVTFDGTGRDIIYADGTINYDGLEFTKTYVEQKVRPLVNAWYDKAGHMSTLTFYADGTMEFYYAPKNTPFQGVYQFDAASGKGTVTIDFAGDKQTYNIVLSGGVLNLNNGEAYFTTDYIEQNK